MRDSAFLDNLIDAFNETGSYRATARKVGVAFSVVRKHLQEAGIYSAATPGVKPTVNTPVVERPEPISDRPAKTWEEVLENASKASDERERQSPSRLLGSVTIKDCKAPIGVFLISDLHLGAPQCDYETFLKHVKLLKSTPNLYAIIQGDVLEYAISQRMLDSVLSQVMTPQEQARIWKSIVDDLSKKLLAAIIGNHELRAERLSGFDLGEYMYQALIKNKVGVYMKDGGTLAIHVGQQKYTWRITHGDSRYGSMYNPNHKAEQLSRMGFGWHDIQSTGHTHDGAIHSFNVPRPDGEGLKSVVALQASSYKTKGSEQYPERLGYARLREVQMPMVILYPDSRTILPFLRVEDGVKALHGLSQTKA